MNCVLPAYAGMIPLRCAAVALRRGAPRVCGDDPKHSLTQRIIVLCSPRMRG